MSQPRKHLASFHSTLSYLGNRWQVALAGLAAAGLLSAGTGCKKTAPPPPPPPIVQVLEVATTNVPLTAEFIGQLDSPQNVDIRARVEGFVDKMLFVEGEPVKEGASLFLLDKGPYVQRLNAANGMLEEAKASLKKYEADVARLHPLATNRAVPKQDLDNAVAAVEVGKASLLSAKARVESATLDLSYCDVRAPISGLIGAKQVSIGELVGKGTPTLMATISTLDPIYFYCNVGEAQFLRAEGETRRTGKRLDDLAITLILANNTEHPETGKFVFIDRAVDTKTGTIRVRAQFPNPGKPPLLRPGMFGRIRVDVGTRADSILVPERAIIELQGKSFAWVVQENKPTQRPVKVGQQFGENVLVLEGLKAGDRIVVEGLQKVREGAVVQPMTAAQITQATAAKAAQEAEAKSAPAAKSGKE